MAGRRNRRKRKRRSRSRSRALWIKILVRLGLVGVGLAMLGAFGLAGMFYYYGSDADLPRISSVHDYHPKTVSRLFDRNGKLVGELAAQRRTVVPISKIPDQLIHAVVAAEDADFFKHAGLDYLGMLRAFFANLRAGRFAQGGSTITQQVVKTFFLSPERTIRRKMQEVILARRLENELDKKEILYLYLNQIYFGHGRYGVQEAARFFFGKDVQQLSVAECALLAGLPQSPERLSPVKHPRRAKQRQTYVLRRMAALDFISHDVAQRLIDRPIRIVRHQRKYRGAAAEVTDRVRAHLVHAFGPKRLARLGLAVHTTLDIELQLAAREAVRWGLRAIDARHHYRGALRHLAGKKLARYRKHLIRSQNKFVDGRLYRGIVTGVSDKRNEIRVFVGPRTIDVPVAAERYNPQHHSASKRFAKGDLVRLLARGGKLAFDPGPQAALVALEAETGDVLAMVGGYDFHAGGFNRATRAIRQPGSAFKPFVYGAALDSGRYTPATIVDDAPVVFKGWEPKNFEGTYRGAVRLRTALAHSINTVAARLIADVGVDKVRSLAQRLGIETPLGRDLSLALGSSGVRPIELATAYAAIANGGKRIEPRYIRRIGKEPVKSADPQQVLRPEVAYVLTAMMRSVVQEGTGRRARRLGRPVAGKTGTTNDQKDAWFVGFTPKIVTAVWVGFDRPRTIGRHETGGRAALPIWLRFMRKALHGRPRVPFPQPSKVEVHRIDPQSGLLATADATDAIDEVFVEGTAPQETARSPEQVDPNTILMGQDVR